MMRWLEAYSGGAMLCSGCGKEIPFVGQVCPFCQRDKAQDQGDYSVLYIVILVSGGIGYLIDGFMGFLWGLGVGMVLGVIIVLSRSSTSSQPPAVRVVPPEPATPSSESDDEIGAVEKRLKDLEALRSKGLITDNEFQAKRQQVLDQL